MVFQLFPVGIYYMIWANISKCPKKNSAPGHDHNPHDSHHHPNHHHNGHNHDSPDHHPVENGGTGIHADSRSVSSDHCSIHHNDHDANYKSNLILYADCHAASRGLFAGLALVVVTIVVIILFFVAVNEECVNLELLKKNFLFIFIFRFPETTLTLEFWWTPSLSSLCW